METTVSIEQIVSDIKSNILNGKYKSHDKLTERVLCEQFNVSRTPIRQALLLMKEEGWLYSKSNSGTYVSPVDRNDVIENYKARMSLEPVVLEMAFPNITKGDIAEMRRICAFFRSIQNIRTNNNIAACRSSSGRRRVYAKVCFPYASFYPLTEPAVTPLTI